MVGRPRSLSESFTLQFYAWEHLGRGRLTFPEPVALEPPFLPFWGFRLPKVRDDTRRPTLLSAWFDRLAVKPGAEQEDEEDGEIEIPSPWLPSDEPLVEWTVLAPQGAAVNLPAVEGWLRSLGSTRDMLSFEIVGSGGEVSVHLGASALEAPFVAGQFRAFFPDMTLASEPGRLEQAWQSAEGKEAGISFGLAREWMLPLPRHGPDSGPLLPVFGALSALRPGEVAVVQVLFETAMSDWAGSARRALFSHTGQPFFSDHPDFNRRAVEKLSQPLVAVSIRLAARSPWNPWHILRELAGNLSGQSGPEENALVPLAGENVEASILPRHSSQSGMLLSVPELARLVHPPGSSIRIPSLQRRAERSKALPEEAALPGVVLGAGTHDGIPFTARLPLEARLRHTHVVGATGTGKSTLLLSLILQDIEEGRGAALLDPHGDLVDEVIARLPQERRGDVLLFDPADEACALSFNILSASSEREKDLLSSDLVAIFRRLSTSWGDQMTAVLGNAVMAFLESSEGGTLLDLRRFLLEADFRKRFLGTVADSYVRYFWEKEFALLAGGKSVGPISTRLDGLLRSRLMRRVLAERRGELDLGSVVASGKVLLAKLSQGALGEENAALLGSLIVSKLHQVALGRQEVDAAKRDPFFLYIDEVQHFATPSMASLLSGARKFGLGLVLAHQDVRQLEQRVPELASALMANAYTRIVFRVGEDDARKLERGFSFFKADDLASLGVGEAVCRLGRADADFRVRTVAVGVADKERGREAREEIRERMRLLRGEAAPLEAALPNPDLPPPLPIPERRASPPPAARPAKHLPPGKGGPEHTYLQELIKRWGEEKGFRAVVEEQIAGGKESVDIALYRGDLSIACEVSVTTPLEHEVGNVRKCLAAGFGTVVAVSLKKARLSKLDKLLSASLSPEECARVHLFTTEDLLAWLDGQPVHEEVGMVRGYKVKVRYKHPKDDRQKRVAEILARSMNGLQRDGG